MFGPLEFKRSHPSIPEAELLDDAHHRPVTRFQFDDAVQVRHPYVGTARGNAVGRIKPPDDVRKADDAHQ